MTMSETISAPYASAGTIVALIRRARERGLPEPLSPQDLSRLGVPDSLANRTLACMRWLGLIDEDGRLTDRVQRLRRAATEEYPGVLADIIRDAYKSVFGYADPAQDDEARIEDAFRHMEPSGQRDRMIMLFMALCREAGLAPGGPIEAKISQARAGGQVSSNVAAPRAARTQDEPKARPPLPTPVREHGNLSSSPTNSDASYPLLHGFVDQLPREGTWTQGERDQWTKAFTATLDYFVKVTTLVASPERTTSQADNGVNEVEREETY